jgi:ribosome-associated heat shock protein Hsp15
VADEACRIDVWLWRARLFKTRTLAASVADAGRIRLMRGGEIARADKASRAIRIGDQLVFAHAGRVVAIRVEALGWRRGPPAEAQALYTALQQP